MVYVYNRNLLEKFVKKEGISEFKLNIFIVLRTFVFMNF